MKDFFNLIEKGIGVPEIQGRDLTDEGKGNYLLSEQGRYIIDQMVANVKAIEPLRNFFQNYKYQKFARKHRHYYNT